MHQPTLTLWDDADSEDPPAAGMRWPGQFVRHLVRKPDGVLVLPNLQSVFLRAGAAAGIPTVH